MDANLQCEMKAKYMSQYIKVFVISIWNESQEMSTLNAIVDHSESSLQERCIIKLDKIRYFGYNYFDSPLYTFY